MYQIHWKTTNAVLAKENQASTSSILKAVGVNFYIFHPRLRGAGGSLKDAGRFKLLDFGKRFFWTLCGLLRTLTAGSNTRSEGGARSPPVQEEEDVFHGSKFWLKKRIKCCQIHFGSICFASQAPENNSGLHTEFSDRWLHLMAFWLEFSSRFATISWEQGKLPCSWMIWVYSRKPRAVLWSLVQSSFKTSPVLILDRVFGIRCGEFELHKACPCWALCWQTAAEAWDKARSR